MSRVEEDSSKPPVKEKRTIGRNSVRRMARVVLEDSLSRSEMKFDASAIVALEGAVEWLYEALLPIAVRLCLARGGSTLEVRDLREARALFNHTALMHQQAQI